MMNAKAKVDTCDDKRCGNINTRREMLCASSLTITDYGRNVKTFGRFSFRLRGSRHQAGRF
jgi:hypothetical protein